MKDRLSIPDLKQPVRELARPDFVRLFETETTSEALSRLRRERIGERIIYFYVTDDAGHLTGVVPTRRLILSDPSRSISAIMLRPVVSVRESEPFGNALQLIAERRLLAVPVVDAEHRLTGVLDVSAFTGNLLDLERRRTADEIFQLAGIHIEEERNRSSAWILGRRFPWLLFNLSSGIAAAFLSQAFDGLLRLVIALAFFVPLILTIAESVAMQSLTLSLSRVQLGVPSLPPAGGVLRELRVGLLLGLSSGAIMALIGFAWLHDVRVAGAVAAGIACAGITGAAFGFLIPRLLHRWKLDPRIASGPVTLALTDLAALAAYFGISVLLLLPV